MTRPFGRGREVSATMFDRLAQRAKLTCWRTVLGTFRPRPIAAKTRGAAAALLLAGLGLGGCAQQPQQLAAAGHPKEYFPSSVYGPASRRVIADGEPIPRGGGQYLVGRPYTIAGQTYYPSERRVTQIGLASWYGDAFHGRLTANGEIYDRNSFTAAHPTMPLPSYARVTNLRNNASMIVRVNDRGPYHSNRVMDVSRRVADALDIRRSGTATVKVEWVGRASLAGSDDAKLAATLRTDGPARVAGIEAGVMTAAVPAPARVASLEPYEPAPSRPEARADRERHVHLDSYRAPRPLRDFEAQPRFDDETPPHRERAHLAPVMAKAGGDEEPSSTGSLPRAHRQIIRADAARRDEGFRGGRRQTAAATAAGLGPAGRTVADSRAQHAERTLATFRHGPAAIDRVLPPARPSRLAALLPPARPHQVGLRMSRSRDD